jgi:hypothetical protein
MRLELFCKKKKLNPTMMSFRKRDLTVKRGFISMENCSAPAIKF